MRKIYGLWLLALCFATGSAYGQASAALCVTYLPDATAYPIAVPFTGTVRIVVTNPDGTVNVLVGSLSGSTPFGNPFDYARTALGGDPTGFFTACAGTFPSFSASTTVQHDVGVSEHITVIGSGGLITVIDDSVNTDPLLPCAVNVTCTSVDWHVVLTQQYAIATGQYTLDYTAFVDTFYIEPTLGFPAESTQSETGTASGSVPVIATGCTVLIATARGSRSIPLPTCIGAVHAK